MELSRKAVALYIRASPESVIDVLTSLKRGFGASTAAEPAPTPSCSLADLTASELLPLVAIRAGHETERARKGVKTYRGSTSSVSSASTAKPEPTERQLLARRLQAVMRTADKRNSTAGMARKAHTEAAETSETKSGNSANAALAASSRANDVSTFSYRECELGIHSFLLGSSQTSSSGKVACLPTDYLGGQGQPPNAAPSWQLGLCCQ